MGKVLAVLAAAAMAAGLGANAQAQKLVVAGYGGSFEDIMRKEIFPPFAKQHGVELNYVAGNSTNTVARLQAQKSNQQVDVAIIDDGPMYQAIALGFCAPIKGLPADDLYGTARYKDDKAVAIGIVATGIMYNKKAFEEKKWAPPESWKDLKDPKYKKQLVIPPLNNTYGLHALVEYAREGGGGGRARRGVPFAVESLDMPGRRGNGIGGCGFETDSLVPPASGAGRLRGGGACSSELT